MRVLGKKEVNFLEFPWNFQTTFYHRHASGFKIFTVKTGRDYDKLVIYLRDKSVAVHIKDQENLVQNVTMLIFQIWKLPWR